MCAVGNMLTGVGVQQQTFGYLNFSGNNVTVAPYLVPNGGTPGTTNQIGTSQNVASVGNYSNAQGQAFITMGAGDSIVLNVGTTTASQWAWVTVIEM